MKRVLGVVAISVGMCAAALPPPASAQATDQWEFGAILYGWLPRIGGSATFRNDSSKDFDVDVHTLLDHLKMTFMGALEARKGAWGAFTDVIYMNVGGSKSQTRDFTIGGLPLPAGVTADLNFNLKATVWTLAGEYRVANDKTASVDLLAGARNLAVKPSLGWTFSADLGPLNPGRTGSSEINENKWDAIVGAKGRVYLSDGREWFVPWYADVGTGQTDLTWQVLGGVGYTFTWGEVLAVWRYMDYRFRSEARLDNLHFNGPAVGVALHWQ